ncbi:MAG TPA: hypothetical protein G4O12_06870, partial [Dehalococcoidia bacterium]|nr:hypothetical protein [Dehalococcoidia bacterium]
QPPTPYIAPYFSESDNELTQEQRQAIALWYTKSVTDPPTIPDIEKKDLDLYMDKVAQYQRRSYLASIDIMNQALALFNYEDYDTVLKMRASCDPAIWHSVNYHWNAAIDAWIAYGMELWRYQEGSPPH